MAVLIPAVAAGSVITLATYAVAGRRLPKRTNFAGRSIPTSAGVLLLPAAVISLAFGHPPFVLYLLLAVVVGFVDDVRGDGGARGFRGHIGALFRGRITTGMVKVVALGGGAVAVGVFEFGVGVSALLAAFLIAGWANLGNLFDVRPGRAIKFSALPAFLVLPFAGSAGAMSVLAVFGGILALFYFDVRGRIMLGDAGAAACGSVVGLLVVSSGSVVLWMVAGLAVISLTVVAEFSSISRFVEEVRVLRWFDSWGRVRS